MFWFNLKEFGAGVKLFWTRLEPRGTASGRIKIVWTGIKLFCTDLKQGATVFDHIKTVLGPNLIVLGCL